MCKRQTEPSGKRSVLGVLRARQRNGNFPTRFCQFILSPDFEVHCRLRMDFPSRKGRLVSSPGAAGTLQGSIDRAPKPSP